MTAQTFKPQRKLGSLSAGAFAALLLLTTGAPQASAEISKQHQNDSSEATSGSSSRSSGSGSSGSSGGYATASNSDRGSRGEGGRSGGRGGGRGDHGGRGGGWHSDGRGDRGGGYRGDRGRGRGWGHGHGHWGGGYRSGRYYGWGGYYGGWGGWWPWWYPTYGGTTVIMEPGYRYGGGGGTGALDLDVSPENAQIFVDGEFVGRADDYDGFPTFLWLASGTYDVGIFHEGYETIVRQYTIRPGAMIDVEDHMRPGNAIPPDELMTPKSTQVRDARIQRNVEQSAEVDRAEAAAQDYDDEDRGGSDQQVGRLLLALWPPDAAIYLDGHFLGTAEEIGRLSAGLVVEPGEHQLEVVRPGYGTIRRTVDVSAGDKTEVKFELNKN